MHVVEDGLDRAGHGVGHVFTDAVGVETEFLAHCLAAGRVDGEGFGDIRVGTFDDLAGNADDRGSGGNFFGHHGIGADLGAGADGERSQDFGSGTNDHAVFQGWVTLALVPTGAAQGDTLIERDIVTDDGCFADHHPHAVINEEASSDHRTGVDLDPGQPA